MSKIRIFATKQKNTERKLAGTFSNNDVCNVAKKFGTKVFRCKITEMLIN